MSRKFSTVRLQIALLTLFGVCAASQASAEVREIPGVVATNFTLTAKADRMATPDGGSIYFWGFSTPGSNGGRAQYPAPTLIFPGTGVVTVTVNNQLPAELNQNVSLAIGGLSRVTATCSGAPALCVDGPITKEAASGGSVTYTFTVDRPGTFVYNSASRPDLQVEMGLTGAMIVRPTGYSSANPQAYTDVVPADKTGNPAGSQFDQEYLFFLSEMDSVIHDLVETQGVQAVDDSGRLSHYFPNYWFINGRNAPDTMAQDDVKRLPTQPYSAITKTHPGDRLLMRVVGGGHDMHPFHHHGQHARIIAMDGFPLETEGAAPGHSAFDLSHEVFTIPSLAGQTVDAIFRWTGKGLGWDIYGSKPHTCTASTVVGSADQAEGLDPTTHEFCGDHGKAIPVTLPEIIALNNGPFYSGSPFLGTAALTNPGDGGLNPDAGYTYMWHSHNEKEITNFDVYPGGMMTMLVIIPPGKPIQ